VIVIGLSGYKRAGKDTVADILVKDHGFTKLSFAAPLKRMVRNFDPIVGWTMPGEEDCICEECSPMTSNPIFLSDLYAWGFDDDEIKDSRYGDIVREYWQRMGTEVMRAEDEQYWIYAALAEVSRSGADKIVFSDTRFPNEADMVYGYNNWHGDVGSVWQISRPGTEPDPDEEIHASESHVGQLNEEVTIINEASFEELADAVAVALTVTEGKRSTLDDLMALLSLSEGTDGEE